MESYISFLGYGIQPPTASWGNMLNNAQQYLTQRPWLAIFPGLMITLAVTQLQLRRRRPARRARCAPGCTMSASDALPPLALYAALTLLTLLTVKDLRVTFPTPAAPSPPCAASRSRCAPARRWPWSARVGSGKSVTSLAIMRLTPAPPRARITGQVMLRRADGTVSICWPLPEPQMRALRGDAIAMIFQEPMTSLNPVHTVGDQIAEAVASSTAA